MLNQYYTKVVYSAWGAYDIQQEGLVLARTNLLLRSLLIDSEPFYSILHSYIDPSKSSMERRYASHDSTTHVETLMFRGF